MIEIKFRAWDTNTGEMHGVSELHLITPKPCLPAVHYEDDIYHEATPIDEVELMQFTGLRDKNGKEIYEGDICKLITSFGEERMFVVRFGTVQRQLKSLDDFEDDCTPVNITGFYFELDEMYMLYPSFYDGKPDNERMEVVGNVWEDGDLVDRKNSKTD